MQHTQYKQAPLEVSHVIFSTETLFSDSYYLYAAKFLYLEAGFDKKKLLSVLLLVRDCSRRNKQLDGRRTGTGCFYISDTQTALSFTVPKLQYLISQNNQAPTAVFDRQQCTQTPFLGEPVMY